MNEKLVKALRNHPVKFAQQCGFTKLTDLHNEWIRSMVLEPEDYTLLGHRGSYKTTCLSFAFAMLIILRPDKTIFFVRKTDDDVIEIVRQTRNLLGSDIFHVIVKEIYDVDLELTTVSAYKINTNLSQSLRGQVQFQGMGLNGSITGKHADFLFTDDIVNVEDRVSKAKREQTIRQYQELQNIKNRGGRIFNTGTPWHVNDCISTQMPNVHKFTVYDTGLITEEEQRNLRSSMTASLYAANYELRHIADKDALFTDAHFYEGNSADIAGGRGHIDAAYGGEDYTAYTCLKRKPDGKFIGYGKIWQGHVDNCLDEILTSHKNFKAGSIACEKNADKGYLARDLRAKGIPAAEYSERENKHIKIATFLKREWNNIEWIKETDADYLAQILDYTENATHDDAPDSAASLIRSYSQGARIHNKNKLLYG